MPYESTLFSHIVRNKLEGQVENVAVEALGYILSQSEAARKALVEALRAGGMNINSMARVETQVTGEAGARPDLVCYDDDGTIHVLIEAKFWAELTKNQPNQYLKQLLEDRQDGPAALLFVAPKARLELLWPELCRQAKKEFDLTVISDSGPVCSASFGSDNHHLQLISWADLLEGMARAARDDDDNDAEADIKQLRGLTDYANPDPFVSWSPGKLGSEFACRMEGLRRLVNDSTSCGESAGFLKQGNVRRGGQGGYGRTIHLGGVQMWFGIDIFAWTKFYSTPLWLRLGRVNYGRLKEVEPPLKLFDPGPVFDIRMPIELPAGVVYGEMLNSVVNCLNGVARRLDPSISPDGVDGAVKKQLHSSDDRLDGFAFQPWDPEELEPECARRLVGLHGIIDEAISCGKDAGILQQAKKKLRQEGYGWSIRLAGVEMWFGIDVTAWAQNSGTPLWLLFEHEEQQELAYVTDILKKVDWRHCIPIDVPADAENDAVLDSVVDSLKRIAERLDPPDAPRPVELEQDQNSG